MGNTSKIVDLINSVKNQRLDEFWNRFKNVENELLIAVPLVSFNYPKTSRVHFSWNGRNIVHDGMDLPVPSPAELESALETLLEKAIGIMPLVDGNVAQVEERGEEKKTTENRSEGPQPQS